MNRGRRTDLSITTLDSDEDDHITDFNDSSSSEDHYDDWTSSSDEDDDDDYTVDLDTAIFIGQDMLILAQKVPHFNDEFAGLVYTILALDSMVCCSLKKCWADHDVLWYLQNVELYCDLRLPDMLIGEKAPSVDFFRSLPSAIDKDGNVYPELADYWAVYALCLECNGKRTLLYIGSATSGQKEGSTRRFEQYARNRDQTFGKMAKKVINEGYTIVHVGVLLLCPKPPLSAMGNVRGLFLTFEAIFTYFFWSLWKGPSSMDPDDHYMRLYCPFQLHELDYGGTNLRSPLSESIRAIKWTEDELVQKAITFEQHRQNYFKDYRKGLNLAVDMLHRFERGEIPDPDPAVQAMISRGRKERYWRRRSTIRISTKVSNARATQKAFDAGQIANIDSEVEAQLELARKEKERLRVHSETVVKPAVKLYRQWVKGEVEVTDPDVQKKIEQGQKRVETNEKSHKKNAASKAAWEKLQVATYRSWQKGEITEPDSTVQALIDRGKTITENRLRAQQKHKKKGNETRRKRRQRKRESGQKVT